MKEIKIEKGKADCSIFQLIYLSSIANKFAICMGINMERKRKYQRLYVIILSLALILQSIYVPNQVQAANANPLSDFAITVRNDNTAIITKFNNATATKVVIPNNYGGVRITEIAANAFMMRTKIEELVIPDTITKIGDSAFGYNTSIKNLVIPGSVKYIGSSAFTSCTSLEKLTILYGVETISKGAFSNCIKLSSVEIAPSVGTMVGNTFQKVNGMTIEAEPGSPAAEYEGDGNSTVSHQKPADNSAIVYAYETAADGTVVIKEYVGSSKTPQVPANINGNAVTGLGNGAFHNKPINSVTLPDSIKTLGDDVFSGTNITELILPSGVTSIGDNLIDNKPGIIIKSDSPYVEEYISKYFTNVRFEPYRVTMSSYHRVTFTNDGNGQVTLGTNGKYKDGYKISINAAPYRRYHFKGWTIVSGLGVFEDATKAETVFTMSSTDVVIRADFEETKRPDFIYKDGTFLEYNISGNLSIAETYKKSDEDQTLVPTTAIAVDAFRHYVDGRWYYGYPTTLTLPTSMTTIPNGTFKNCNSLKEITVTEPNSYFTSEDGVLFNNDKTILLAYPQGKTASNYVMPNTVIEIAPNAFYSNSYLENITLSNKLEEIGYSAFEYAGKLKEIILPDTVTTIGSSAFRYTGLKKVVIKAGVTSIGTSAFNSCYSMENIEVAKTNPRYSDDSGVLYDKTTNELMLYPIKKAGEQYTIKAGTITIGTSAFYNSGLKTIEIPNSVVTIGTYAFQNSTKLEGIVFPSGLTKLSAGVLYNCNSLSSVELPSGLTDIDSSAFWYCSSLTSITIPSSVTSMADGIFYSCKKLETINVSSGNQNYVDENGILYTADKTKLICYPAAKQTETNQYTVAVSTKNISSYAFAFTTLKEVDLLASVESIGYEAFTYCSNLTNVIMRNKQVNIGSSLFWGTNTSKAVITGYFKSTAEDYALNYGIKFRQIDDVTNELIISNFGEVIGYTGNDQVVIIPSAIETPDKEIISVTSIGKNAFRNPNNKDSKVYEQITKVHMPYSIKNIAASAFDGCKSLTDDGLELPVGLTTIGASAFNNCSSLTKVNIPARVSSIATSAFDGCTALTQILVNSSNGNYTNINGVLTDKAKSTICRVPMAFTGDNGQYVIPESVTSMNAGSMEGCTGITNININKMKFIDQGAFKNAFTSPVEINLSGVDDIDNNAFEGCTGITSINIPNSVTRIGDNVFYGCDNLTEISAGAENTVYTSVDGVLFNKNMTALVSYPVGKQLAAYTIPDGVYQIYDNAFHGSKNLTTINMPNTVLMIGKGAFSNGAYLNINLSKGLEQIGDKAFEGSGQLISINIPSHVQSIGASAFAGCVKLADVVVYSRNVMYSTNGDVFNQGLVDPSTLRLHGYAGSTTESYANEKGISFVLINAADANIETLEQTIADATMIYNMAIEGNAQGEYATGSKATFKTAIDIANGVKNQTSTQADIAAAITNLQNAMKIFATAMVPYAPDKTQLYALYQNVNSIYIAAVEGTVSGQYEIGSKAILLLALDGANTAIANTNASQGDIDSAFMTLQSALVDFQNKLITDTTVRFGELLAGVSIAEARHNAATEGDTIGKYAIGSKTVYWSVILSAKGLLNNLSSVSIESAIAPTSFGAVNMSISNTASPSAVNFTYRSTVTQDQVNAAVKALVKAGIVFENSKIRPVNMVNTSSLKIQLAYAEGIYSTAVEGSEVGNYPVGKKAEFKAAIERAYAVLFLDNPLQSEIDYQYNTLQQAINIFQASKITESVTPEANKTVLFERLQTAADERIKGIYSQGSIDILDSAITFGQGIYRNADATQDQITEALRRLDTAIAGLVIL